MVGLIDRSNCPLCGAVDGSLLAELPLDQGAIPEFFSKAYSDRARGEFSSSQKFALYQCKSCDFVWQRWVLDDEGMHFLYDKWIDPIESFTKNKTHPASYYRPLFQDVQFITQIYSSRRPHQIKTLDFGMGWGGWTRVAMAMGLDAFGSELSKSRIEFAQQIGIRLFNDLNSESAEFDYINTEQVLEHIPNIHLVMDALYRLLKRGGILRMSVPTVDRELALIRKNQWVPGHDAFHPLEHINGFTWKSVQYLAKRHNFKIANVQFFFKLTLKNPKNSIYIFKRMLSHYFNNNILLIKP